MFEYLFGLTLLKSINPYFRKHILNTLESHDFLFMNTICITFFVLLFFLYKYFFHAKTFTLKKMMKNIRSLSYSQYACLIILSLLTVSSSIFLYDLDKNYNTPLVNSVFLRVGGIVALLLVGIFVFEEKYSYKQIFGIFLTLFGVYLIAGDKSD
jgi:drug/metabolite transporter (DMT)-like permease